MRVIGRLAESEDPVLFARFDEVGKCAFIKANAPKEAWEAWTSSDDDGAGLLVKAYALREQAREVRVSAARSRTSSLPQPAVDPRMSQLSLPCVLLALTTVTERRRHRFWHTTAALASGRRH